MFKMKTIIKVLTSLVAFTMFFSTLYFIQLYVHLTKLVLAIGLGGFVIFIFLIYIYDWMLEKDKDFLEFNHALDVTREYVKEVEDRLE